MNTRLLAITLLTLPFPMTGLYFIFSILRSKRWPTVPGKIVEAKSGIAQAGTHLSYAFKARYSYSVHGRNFESTRITIADWFYASGVIAVRRFEKLFPIGREVAVYHDPVNPSRSVLYNPGFASAIFVIIFGIAAFVVLWANLGR